MICGTVLLGTRAVPTNGRRFIVVMAWGRFASLGGETGHGWGNVAAPRAAAERPPLRQERQNGSGRSDSTPSGHLLWRLRRSGHQREIRLWTCESRLALFSPTSHGEGDWTVGQVASNTAAAASLCPPASRHQTAECRWSTEKVSTAPVQTLAYTATHAHADKGRVPRNEPLCEPWPKVHR